MTTLADLRDRIADMLSRSDLETQITQEIGLACARYAKKITHLTEVRGAILDTVAEQVWYSTVDLSGGASYSDVSARTSVAVREIVKLEYIRRSTLFEPMKFSEYKDFEALQDTSGAPGPPYFFTLYAGQIGLWPAPVDVEEIYFSAQVKPVVPTDNDAESVFFDECQELIEVSAAGRVARKYLRDFEVARDFEAQEALHYSDLLSEHVAKSGTGRIRQHC